MRRETSRKIVAYAMMAPVFVLVVVFIVYPVFYGLLISFFDSKLGVSWGKFVGLGNYQYLLGNQEFWSDTWTSVIWLAGNLFLMTIVSLGAALLLNQRFKGASIARSLMLLPWAIPAVAVAILWRWMLQPSYGFIAIFLGLFNLPYVILLADVRYTLLTVMLVNTWRFAPFGAILMLAALQMMRQDLYDAARIDGASPLQIFVDITMPLLRPILLITTILGVVWNFNVFDLIWLMTKGGPAGSTETLPILMYRMAFQSWEMSRGAAISVILSAIMAIFLVAWFKFVIYKEEK